MPKIKLFGCIQNMNSVTKYALVELVVIVMSVPYFCEDNVCIFISCIGAILLPHKVESQEAHTD